VLYTHVALTTIANFQARDVGDAVYESNWYELPVTEFKKCLTMVMVKSQKIVIFSGYGIVWINLRTFLLASLLTHKVR
jgi:hypothetical protein